MTRIRDIDKAENIMEPFERFHKKSRKESSKVSKATESLIESLSDQNKLLSEQNLLLSKLFREAYRRLPDKVQEEIDVLKSTWNLDNLEVHP